MFYHSRHSFKIWAPEAKKVAQQDLDPIFNESAFQREKGESGSIKFFNHQSDRSGFIWIVPLIFFFGGSNHGSEFDATLDGSTYLS